LRPGRLKDIHSLTLAATKMNNAAGRRAAARQKIISARPAVGPVRENRPAGWKVTALERSDNVADSGHAFALLKRGYTRWAAIAQKWALRS